MSTVVNRQTMSDAELIAASRTGDADAYAELYRRHLPAARAAARAMCRNHSDADDLVSEGFINMLRILQNGNGPDVAFRPYLLVAIRNRFYDTTRRVQEDPLDAPTEELNLALIDSAAGEEDKMLIAAAFATLPERWQLVLWHTEIEGRSPAEAAPLIGLAPNAVAALAYRAREGLRQAFLQAHLQTPRESACRACAGNLGAYVRDGLSDRDRRRVGEHLAGCESCRALLVELTGTNAVLRAALVPAIVGVPATVYLSGLGGRGVIGWFGRLSRLQQAGTATAAAAAAAVAALVIAAIVSTGGTTPTIASPRTTQPRTAATTVVETTVASATATSTGTTIPLPTMPPVLGPLPPAISATLPTGSINRVPTRTVPQGAPDTAAPTTIPATETSAPAAPTTAVASSPVPATTVPVVPRLTLASVQLGVGLLGGEARVRLTVSATALPANRLRADAFANLVVSAPLPAGVSLAGADNPAWSCTAQGTCTIASIDIGSSSAAVLRLAIAANVALPISFAPTVTTPADAVVRSQPLSITAEAIAGLQIQEYARGSVVAIGNTVLTDCIQLVCLPVDIDTDPTTFNSSTADLNYAGTVAKALLVWSGDRTSADRNTVKFLTPLGTIDIVADHVQADYSAGYNDAFVAYKDVTAQVTMAGSYGVANLRTSAASYGGWSLIVLTHDSSQPERSLMIAVPLSYVTDGTPTSLVLAGSSTTSAAHVVVSAFEGDAKPSIGDTLKFNGIDLGGVDAFRGAISAVPRTPELVLNYRVDLFDAIVTSASSDTATLDFATTNDAVMIAALGIALDLS